MTATPSVFAPFLADHRRVLAQLAEIERTIERGGRRNRLGPRAEQGLQSIVTLLYQQFATHMAAEEHVVYPALLEALPEARVSLEPLQSEHTELRSMLIRLDELLRVVASPERDEQVIVAARDLVDLLRIHIGKEERSVFTIASRVLTARELSRLASRIGAHRKTPRRTAPAVSKGRRS